MQVASSYLKNLDGGNSLYRILVFLRPESKQINHRYLFYWTLTLQDFIDHLVFKCSEVQTILLSRIKYRSKRKSLIPLPPLSEQWRIVGTYLDEADSHCGRSGQKPDAKAQRILPALFIKNVFGRITPVTNPKGWDIALMGDLLEIKPNYGTMISPSTDNGEWLDLRVANIQNGTSRSF